MTDQVQAIAEALKNVTRMVLIIPTDSTDTGRVRVYDKSNVSVQIDLQDDGGTLEVLVGDRYG